MYQSNSKPKPSDSDEQVEGDETLEDPAKQPLEATSDDPFEHFKTDRIFADGKATELPLHIELQNPHPGETKHMRRRNIPQKSSRILPSNLGLRSNIASITVISARARKHLKFIFEYLNSLSK